MERNVGVAKVHAASEPSNVNTMMMTDLYKALFTFSLIAGSLSNGMAQGRVIEAGPQGLSQVSTIGESLHNAGQRPLHFLYVHGIGATSAGDSHVFLQSICCLLKGCAIPAVPVPIGRDYADRGEFTNGSEPPTFKYLGKPIWRNKDEWSASAPFVDHYVLPRTDGGPIVVDELNWWPLVFPLKCRNIMPGEAHLAGPDANFLNICSKDAEKDESNVGRYKAFQWISSDEAKTLKSIHPKGALLNRALKNNILDWGFSDAIIAVGSIHSLLREGMRQLLVASARFNADGSKTDGWEQQANGADGIDREFAVVSHSLGSYLVFSTLNLGQRDPPILPTADAVTEDSAARYILERTSLVYFFANQVALLELADVAEPATAVGTANGGALSTRITEWRKLRLDFEKRHAVAGTYAAKPPQVIAWSDSSDLLSWYVPPIDDVVIVNLFVRNTRWHWLFANPEAAHDNYASNKHVLRVMLGSKAAPGL
jgi:hypothetical protein